MNVDARVCYGQDENKVYVLHSQAQVVMVRELCSNWKQPIFFDSDIPMTGSLLKQIILEVQKVGFVIVGVLSDMGGKNKRVWRDLEVDYKKSCFDNPSDAINRIWAFQDVPHMIKLFRNHFIDDAFTLPSEKIINKTIIKNILSMDGDISFNSSAVEIAADTNDYLTSNLFAELLPDMTEALAMIENDSEISEISDENFPEVRVTQNVSEFPNRNAWLFVGQLKLQTTPEAMKNYQIKRGLKENVTCEEITTNFSTKAFKVGIPYEHLTRVNEENFWPAGIAVRRFRFRPFVPNRIMKINPSNNIQKEPLKRRNQKGKGAPGQIKIML
ncbi:hypothetical protein ANN_27597 [Periplaneta americana]|uniref:Transposable element P transposase-like RNase H domain-containing protein n=1 Tax=Periplaneta americana TaxID=6978 RepID=A0ABQ8RWB3_PERAM|nr:hypothetical protein ANN_27597 [Periplaneta americana]